MREALELLDAAASLASLAGSFLCVWLMQVVLCDGRRFVHLQRVALGILAIALAVDGLAPDWAAIGGHQPTGDAVDFALVANLVIMAVRAAIGKAKKQLEADMQARRPERAGRRVHG